MTNGVYAKYAHRATTHRIRQRVEVDVEVDMLLSVVKQIRPK